MRGTSAVFVKPCLLLALLVGGPGPAENEMMPTSLYDAELNGKPDDAAADAADR